MSTLFVNGRIFQTGAAPTDDAIFHSAMVVKDGKVRHVGSETDAEAQASKAEPGTTVYDLGGRTVLPGFVDGHVHLLALGYSLKKAPLEDCKTLEDIRTVIKNFAAEHPEYPRILCRNWMFSMTPGTVTAAMLDDLDPRPIYIESKDLHATWCNTAALKDLGLWDNFGHEIKGGDQHRDPVTKQPSGLLSEAYVFDLVWPHLSQAASLDERIEALTAAVDAYTANGYTGVVDMALQEESLEAMLHYIENYKPSAGRGTNAQAPLRITAYWLVKPRPTEAEHIAQVDKAIELMKKYGGGGRSHADGPLPSLRVVGIKIVCDGIVDACTAALSEPYGDSARTAADAIWSREMVEPVVKHATEGGLQVALHAIGDAAITMAVDTIAKNPGQKLLRPRIEHLELASADDARRLGELGITASIQPVHADPAILRAWPALLGEHRCGRAFAYKDFSDSGAPIALGTDAPTAPYEPLRNAYIATTRCSAREPDAADLPPVNPKFALTLCETLTAATRGAAYSVFADAETGSLEAGKAADFSVVDMAWDATKLLDARIDETWYAGEQVYKA
ncbi:amidohydrolase family protein [Ophiostoma piceae UAMH 11346]|uniref:Amidohydrolase family protein n=1 Tax=Ophiostoma piceae (strain UAMH 11346) TaxID=1262450 RepID=S3D8J5_OPHP1|nr:amidohydrolase family protein [Ophiostoma piceae UAMH 11346]